MRDRLHYNPEHVLAFLSWIHFLPISCGLSRANLLSETISLFFFPYYPYLFVVYGCFFFHDSTYTVLSFKYIAR